MAFDIHCTTDNGKRFIVEMQNISQEWFVERCLMYGARGIIEQSKSGDWDYFYKPVISIAFTNFTIPRFEGQVISDSSLIDKYSHKTVSDRLRLIFIQLPEFNKVYPEDCKTNLEEWIYTIKNMKHMETIPFATKRPIFKKVENLAKMENMSPSDRSEYERELKAYWDYCSTMKHARKEGLKDGHRQGLEEGLAEGLRQGLAEGRAEGRAEGEKARAVQIAKKMKEAAVMSIDQIAEFTQLPVSLVMQL